MQETISIIYKLNSGLHRVISNLTCTEAISNLIDNLNSDNPRANTAIGLIQIGEVSTAFEMGNSTSENISKIIIFYKIQLTNLANDPSYRWGSVTE